MPATQHDRLCQTIAEVLKVHKGVAALVGDRVYVPGDTVGGLPCVVISKGKEHSGIPGQLKQFTVKVSSRTDSEQVLPSIVVAVQGAINGFRKGEVSQCVLMDTGKMDEEDGYHFRVDTFGVFAKATE